MPTCNRLIRLLCVGVAALAGLCAPAQVGAADKAQTARCAALADLRLPDVNILSSTVAKPMEEGLPETCRVLGYVRPAVNFELHMPIKVWNEKFYMAGCSGFCGRIELGGAKTPNTLKYGLAREYAAATMDGGHWSAHEGSALWAYNAPQAEVDYGRRSAPAVATTSKALIDAFYAEDLRFSYFAGCGNGGRQGVMAAMTYPDVFDGVIAGAPWLSMTETLGVRAAWFSQALRDPAGELVIGAEEAALVARKVYESCDAKDGVADGLLSNPTSCAFDLGELACDGDRKDNADGPICLTDSELDVVNRIYQRPNSAFDERLASSGQIFGAEPFWGTWITGDLETDGLLTSWGEEFLRYLAFDPDPGAAYRIGDFFMDRDPDEWPRWVGSSTFRSTPRKAPFGEGGGRLIMYHGWSDAASSPIGTIEYLHALEGSSEGGDDWGGPLSGAGHGPLRRRREPGAG